MDWIEIIKNISAVIVAAGVISAAAIKIYKWVCRPQENQKDIEEMTQKQEEDIRDIKKEQCMHTYVLLAILEGLKQKGCNGPVTEASEKLSKYINKQAHGMEE